MARRARRRARRLPPRRRRRGAHRRGRRPPAVLHRASVGNVVLVRRRRRGQQPALRRRAGRRRGARRQPRVPGVLLLLPAPHHAARRVRLPDASTACRSTRSTSCRRCRRSWDVPHRPLRGQDDVGPPHPRRVAVAAAGHRASRTTSIARARGGGCTRALPPALDRERRAHAARDGGLAPRPGEQHVADRLPARDRAVPRRSRPRGSSRASSRSRPTSHYRDGNIILPATAAERRRHPAGRRRHRQRVVAGRVAVGEPVTVEVHAEVPPGAGTIIAVTWDFDGSGTFPSRHPVDGTANELDASAPPTRSTDPARTSSRRSSNHTATATSPPRHVASRTWHRPESSSEAHHDRHTI